MLLSRHQNAGQNREIKIGNRCFENVAQFRYLGTTITDRNLIHEEIKRRLNARIGETKTAYRILVGEPEGKRPLGRPRRRNLTIYMPQFLYESETWSLILLEQHCLRAVGGTDMRGSVCKKSYRAPVGKPQGNRSLGRPKLRWEDSIKMDVKEIVMEAVDWITISCKLS
ncbi:hypothetical protein B7P43_G06027 [Cryptotermes secundus]|uniref:Reverse transcriptase domain-containing protein n=1 Tax=Cryptotermes secundus TaxID=105785 RepID=A0A2J7PDC0_9NEOP|nr:hypothetical protein B7P43_G06027 [Cryptotermes secundus]